MWTGPITRVRFTFPVVAWLQLKLTNSILCGWILKFPRITSTFTASSCSLTSSFSCSHHRRFSMHCPLMLSGSFFLSLSAMLYSCMTDEKGRTTWNDWVRSVTEPVRIVNDVRTMFVCVSFQVFTELLCQKKGKISVFYCGPPALSADLTRKCRQYGFAFKKELF